MILLKLTETIWMVLIPYSDETGGLTLYQNKLFYRCLSDQNKLSCFQAHVHFRNRILKSFTPYLLIQICECAVMTNRLEVLNLSGNRLTDACGSYLFTILQKCKGRYCLWHFLCFCQPYFSLMAPTFNFLL
jgi:hypothetical protein